MRRLLLALVLVCPAALAQPADSIYTIVSEPPALLPSQQEAYVQIRRFFRYPAEAAADSVSGNVLLRLVVDTTGLATVDAVLRSIGHGCDEAARNVVQYVRFSPGRHEGRAVRTYVTLPVPCHPPASSPPPPTPPPSPSEPTAPPPLDQMRIGACMLDEVIGPEILPDTPTALRRMHQRIRYPQQAKAARLQGRVIVRLTVGIDGLPQNIHVPQPLGLGLDEEAIRGVSTLRFRPAKCHGEPVEIQMTVPVTFGLR